MIKCEVKKRKIVSGHIYCLFDEHNGICRIGKTKWTAMGRIQGQTAYYPFELKVTKAYFSDHTSAEAHFHKTFNQFKHRADWYKITPSQFNTEVKKLKEHIKQINPPVFRPSGEDVSGVIKIWHIMHDKKEFKCEFVHVDFINKILRLKCNFKVVKIKFSNNIKFNEAKSGHWVQGLAMSKKEDKLIHIRFK